MRLVKSSPSIARVCKSANRHVSMVVAFFCRRHKIPEIEINSDVVFAAEGINAAIIRREKIGQNPLLAGLCCQDMELGNGRWRVTLLGEIVQRLSDYLRRQTRDRHKNLSPGIHPCNSHPNLATVVAGVAAHDSEIVWVRKSSRSCTNGSGYFLLSVYLSSLPDPRGFQAPRVMASRLEACLLIPQSQPVAADHLVVGTARLQVLADDVNVLEDPLERMILVDRGRPGGVI